MLNFRGLFRLPEQIHAVDIGAAAIAEKPIYLPLLESGLAHLSAFDGDDRQSGHAKEAFGNETRFYSDFVYDGSVQTAYIASPQSGMTSLLPPDPAALKFFNGFTQFGTVHETVKVQTKTLDSITDLPNIDLLKMDVQGAELTILRNGLTKLKSCIAIQLEVSFMCLYQNQPAFGELDSWLREKGFSPHCFLDVKRWSISPTVFQGDFRIPGNQLLEADIVYIKNPLLLDLFSDAELKKLTAVADQCLKSVDLCVHLIRELEARGLIGPDGVQKYLHSLKARE